MDGDFPPEMRRELIEKYAEMRRLRLGDADGSIVDPRPHMAALAQRFPGVLREIDRLPLAEIDRRLHELGELATMPEWAALSLRFHRLLRGALCTKRWLGRQTLDGLTRERFLREASTLCFDVDALEWRDDLSRVQSPPRGRMTALVFERMAAELGASSAEVQLAVWPWESGG